MTAEVTPELAAWLQTTHRSKLSLYQTILADPARAYFDVVVITSADAEQTATYEANIDALLAAGRIPRQPSYVVFPDPPGGRVGCGGATLYVLDALEKKYGAAFAAKRVLLIHAGGYSKRLPNHSHCGKIYSLLPVPSPGNAKAAMSMLELKLLTFAHVPAQVPAGRGGVFVTCSDDLIFYDHSVCDFSNDGFTALGHPSPVTIGKDHGVFVLDSADDAAAAGPAACRKFIHKYSVDAQRAEGAVVGKTGAGLDEVFTDSSYFFSGAVSERLLAVFRGPMKGAVEAEVDAYGDFMQAVGAGRTRAHFTDFGNTAKKDDAGETARLTAAREALYDALEGVPLHCLRLPRSRFYHVGTMKEALHHFCVDEGFLTCLAKQPPLSTACVIESLVAGGAKVEGPSVVEFSRLAAGSGVCGGCIVSGVALEEGTVVAERTFLQTMPVLRSKVSGGGGVGGDDDDDVAYVTHVLSTDDDIKRSAADVLMFGTDVAGMLPSAVQGVCVRRERGGG